MKTPTFPELYEACSVLFGPEVNVSFEFLRYLQPAGVTAAYRQRARETHPDRAVVIGKSPESLAALFRDVRQAYEKLNAVIGNDAYFRGVAPIYGRTTRTAAPHRTAKPKSRWAGMSSGFHPGDFFYQKTGSGWKRRTQKQSWTQQTTRAAPHNIYLPKTPLLFGQYLYYSGHIKWDALISAVVWQRMQRPLVGKLAVDWRLISEDQVREILLRRQTGERFGDCAVRLRKMTDQNIRLLLWRQKHLQKPIGTYFIEKGLLSPQKIDLLAHEAKQHNAQALFRRRQTAAC